jgi:uncharacterized caspase-like protein
LFADGRLFKEIAVKGPSIVKEVRLDGLGSARWLTVLAVDDRGFVSLPSAIQFPQTTRPTERLFGVLAGVDIYSDPRLGRLRYGRSDAERVRETLRANRGHYYADVETTLLADRQATPDAILKAIDRVAGFAREEDTLVFFFAGHGIRGPGGNFFITGPKFRLKSPEGTGLSWTRLARALERVKARVIVLIDACHSGGAGAELATNDGAVASLLAGAKRPMIVLAAAKGRQFSREHPSVAGGYFTHAFAQVLTNDRAEYDLNKNGVIEVSELYRGLKKQVVTVTRGQQTPWIARRDLIGDFAAF